MLVQIIRYVNDIAVDQQQCLAAGRPRRRLLGCPDGQLVVLLGLFQFGYERGQSFRL